MINISHLKDCCGCSACANICPVTCITMQADVEGFEYPQVDAAKCIHCGKCMQVCPFLHPFPPVIKPEVFAAKHRDVNAQISSSSGGVFMALAQDIVRNSGVVFGARWDQDWSVCHDASETLDGVRGFQGSKYVASRMGNCFRTARKFLEQGRQVLFSGTPCQIAGLKRYLQRDYSNLLSVDLVCHGVPTPRVFQAWLQELSQQFHFSIASIRDIFFKDKMPPYSWRNAGFVLRYSDNHTEPCYHAPTYRNSFGKGFLANLYLRPACHHCAVKPFRSGSDLTLGDFWGLERVNPTFCDSNGVSIVFANTQRGIKALQTARDRVAFEAVAYKSLKHLSPMAVNSARPSKNRQKFFAEFQSGMHSLYNLVDKYAVPSRRQKVRTGLSRLLAVVGLRDKIRAARDRLA